MMGTALSDAERSDWDDEGCERLPSLEGLQVLVVDDADEAREAIRAVLGESGASVIAVASAQEALSALSRRTPDVLVSDIAMPGMDGHQLIRQVRALTPERGGGTPAAALTAYASTADRTRALLAGYQLYLSKPFEPVELVQLVATLAGRTG